MNQESQHLVVITTVAGKAFTPGGSYFKARAWLLLDGSLILCIPNNSAEMQGVGISRIIYDNILSSTWNEGSRQLIVNLTDGTNVSVDASGCGCSLGHVANAAPVEGKYTFTRVANPPPWYQSN